MPSTWARAASRRPAQDDLDIGYANAASQPLTGIVPVDLSLVGTPANPLLPGVYEPPSTGPLQINTGLTLDFQGNPNAVFIFRGTDLLTSVGPAGSVTIVNGGSAPSTCNIYLQLSDGTQSVTLGTVSAFKGTTMALGASVLGSGATGEGRILTRRSKAVSLQANTITRTACSGSGCGADGVTSTLTPPLTTIPDASSPAQAGGPASAVEPARGSAQFSGGGAVRGPFTVSVTGNAITSVAFYVDGRRVLTVPARRGRTKFKLKVDPRGQSRRMQQIMARVTFTTASRTGMTTHRITYQRVPPQRPSRFTG